MGRSAGPGLGLVFQPLFLALQQVVEFPDQFQKPGVVFLVLDQLTQLIHAFAFVWFHGEWDGATPQGFVREKGYSPPTFVLRLQSSQNQGEPYRVISTNEEGFGFGDGLYQTAREIEFSDRGVILAQIFLRNSGRALPKSGPYRICGICNLQGMKET